MALEAKGFTLIELMVSVALIGLLSVLLLTMTNSTASTWRYTSSRVEQFRGANVGFEAITRRLSQATLNTYWDYDAPNKPTKYVRQSDLRFITGKTETLLASTAVRRPTQSVFFQAPLGFVEDTVNFSGLSNLLNTWGYYVEFNKDDRPAFITDTVAAARYRYRLMELMQPANTLSVYQWTTSQANYTKKDWFTRPILQTGGGTIPPTRVLAENVVGLYFLPKLAKTEDPTGIALAPNYSYDTTVNGNDPALNPRHQLPPVVQVTLIAIDERSAERIAAGAAVPAIQADLDAKFFLARDFNADLTTLQNALTARGLSYRVFTSSVSIRGAKWSRK